MQGLTIANSRTISDTASGLTQIELPLYDAITGSYDPDLTFRTLSFPRFNINTYRSTIPIETFLTESHPRISTWKNRIDGEILHFHLDQSFSLQPSFLKQINSLSNLFGNYFVANFLNKLVDDGLSPSLSICNTEGLKFNLSNRTVFYLKPQLSNGYLINYRAITDITKIPMQDRHPEQINQPYRLTENPEGDSEFEIVLRSFAVTFFKEPRLIYLRAGQPNAEYGHLDDRAYIGHLVARLKLKSLLLPEILDKYKVELTRPKYDLNSLLSIIDPSIEFVDSFNS